MTWETILVQFVIPAAAALLGWLASKYHTSISNPSQPDVPVKVPDNLFPKHPLLSHLVATYGPQIEAALLDQLKNSLGLEPQKPAAK